MYKMEKYNLFSSIRESTPFGWIDFWRCDVWFGLINLISHWDIITNFLLIPTNWFIHLGTGWSKVNIYGPVCFGAKDDSYGRFTVQVTGKVITAKLVHISGYVANSRTIGGYWGNPSRKLRTVITTADNYVVFPGNYTPRETYILEGYSSTSSELVFPNASEPGYVTRGQELRIWFVEDLGNFSEGDNSGQLCADVFLFYL